MRLKCAKATKFDQQNEQKLAQKDDERSEVGLFQTSPSFSILTVVVKDFFPNQFIFLTSFLAFTLNL